MTRRHLHILLATVVLPTLIAGCGGDPADPDAPVVIADARADAMPPPPDAMPDAAPVNCNSLPTSPVPVTVLSGYVASEDLAFDAEGNLFESDTINIYKTRRVVPPSTGRTTFVPSLQFRAGMRLTATNKLIVNNDQMGTLVRIDPDGTRHPILSGLDYPNGMEIGNDGFVYISAQSSSQVLRVDPETGASTLITGAVNQPNGLTFNRDYSTLYIGAFSGEGTIYAVDIDAAGAPSNFRPWKTGVGTGYLDGMAVDACNNVYIADYGQSKILRIAADASTITTVVDQSGPFSYMPNFQWGSGVGGWDSHKLYIVSVGEGLFEVDLGVDSKPRL